jgi:hypothetical protein
VEGQSAGRIRVLVANEPRAYREVLGGAIAGMRPDVAVTIGEPDQLDRRIEALAPHVVVTSRPPAGDLPGVCRLVMLYPDGSNSATIDVDGVRTTVADLELDALLALIDATRATDRGARLD